MSLRVLYVASLPHSGSTLLDLLLGAHSQIESLGEIGKLSRYTKAPVDGAPLGKRQRCTCGAMNIWTCPYWTSVDHAVRKRRKGGLRSLEINSPNPSIFAADNLLLFESIASLSGKPVIVDSSKSLQRLRGLRAIDGMEVRPILMYRQPHGQISSMANKYGDPEQWIAENVRANNALIDFLSVTDYALIRYEFLVAAPKRALTRLLVSLDLKYEEHQLDRVGRNKHNIGGNRMRFHGVSEIKSDESWRETLCPELIADIDRAIAPLTARLPTEN